MKIYSYDFPEITKFNILPIFKPLICNFSMQTTPKKLTASKQLLHSQSAPLTLKSDK